MGVLLDTKFGLPSIDTQFNAIRQPNIQLLTFDLVVMWSVLFNTLVSDVLQLYSK